MQLAVLAVLSLLLIFPEPPLPWVTSAEQIALLVALVTVLPAVVAMFAGRVALRRIDEYPNQPSYGQSAFASGMMVSESLLGVGHGVLLTMTDWLSLCRSIPMVGDWPFVPSMIAICPFLLAVVLMYVSSYLPDRAIREIALELSLYRGRSVRPVWSLLEYIDYHFRHQVLFVLIPTMAILAVRDVVYACSETLQQSTGFTYTPDALLGLSALAVAVLTPWMLRFVWSTRRLPDGPLRDRLTWICKQLGLHCREILVWNSGGHLVNAAVMGVMPQFRYILISDGMLEELDDEKIEAVFGHEAGHVKLWHIPYFLMFALITGCLITVHSVYTRDVPANSVEYQFWSIALGAVLMLKWGFLFGFVSRRFEWQADLFGARTLTLAGLPCGRPCSVHAEAGRYSQPTALGPVCSSAASLFSSTLQDVAVLNGIPMDAASWRHGTIEQRVRLLDHFAVHPESTMRFERRLVVIKAVIFVAAIAACAAAVYAMRLWRLLPLLWNSLLG
jgi:STE24 endopeptidase